MIDTVTLGVMIGVGSLALAFMVSVYSMSLGFRHHVLNLWRWGQILSGSGLLLNALRAGFWIELPFLVAHLLMIVGWGLEAYSYCQLLARCRARRPFLVFMLLLVVIHMAVIFLIPARTASIVSIALIGACLHGIMAVVLFLPSSRNRGLRNIVGAASLFLALAFALRGLRGILFGTLLPFHNADLSTPLLYMVGYLALFVDGFGFLLLVKQDDDESLRLALARVRNAEVEQRELLSIASHEFRTPAAMIKATLDSLRYIGDSIPPEVKSRLENIEKATLRLTNLTDGLIAQDRLQHLALAPRPRHISLDELVRKCIAPYPAGTSFRLKHPTQPVSLLLDPTLVSIAVCNLIDNAIRFSKGLGGEMLPVSVAFSMVGDDLWVEVADLGPGIPDGEKPKIFERYYSTKVGFSGGLGMPIVKTVAAAYQGSVEVVDNVPQGALMLLKLPRCRCLER